jgi:hypothetical protein
MLDSLIVLIPSKCFHIFGIEFAKIKCLVNNYQIAFLT